MVLALGAGVLLIGAGCGAKNNAAVDKEWNGPGNRFAGENQINGGFRGMNFATGTVADLIIGKQVTVLGESAGDGSVSAERIMLGDFLAFGNRTGTAAIVSGTPGSGQNGNGSVGRRNWEGERAGGQAGSNGMGGRAGMARAVGQNAWHGEILNLAADNFILKMGDGGSKIIFYSSSTLIMIATKPLAPPIDSSSTSPIN